MNVTSIKKFSATPQFQRLAAECKNAMSSAHTNYERNEIARMYAAQLVGILPPKIIQNITKVANAVQK